MIDIIGDSNHTKLHPIVARILGFTVTLGLVMVVVGSVASLGSSVWAPYVAVAGILLILPLYPWEVRLAKVTGARLLRAIAVGGLIWGAFIARAEDRARSLERRADIERQMAEALESSIEEQTVHEARAEIHSRLEAMMGSDIVSQTGESAIHAQRLILEVLWESQRGLGMHTPAYRLALIEELVRVDPDNSRWSSQLSTVREAYESR